MSGTEIALLVVTACLIGGVLWGWRYRQWRERGQRRR